MIAIVRMLVAARPARVIVIVLGSLSVGLLALPTAFILRFLVDSIGSITRLELVLCSAVLVSAAILANLVENAVQYVTQVHQAAVKQQATQRLFKSVLKTNATRVLESERWQREFQYAKTSIDSAPMTALMFFPAVISSVTTVLSFAVTLLTVWPPITLFILFAGGVLLVLHHRLAELTVRSMFSAMRPLRWVEYYINSAQTPHINRAYRAHAASDFLERKISQELTSYNAISLTRAKKSFIAESLVMVGIAVVLIIPTVIVANLVSKGHVGVGDLVLFLTALIAVNAAIGNVAQGFGQFSEAWSQLGNLINFLNRSSAHAREELGDSYSRDCQIEGLSLSYSYPGSSSYAIKDVDVRITKGQTIWIKGPNGSGKSTLAKILAGFHTDYGGSLQYSRDLRRCPERVMYVGQEELRVPLTLVENLTFGARVRSEDIQWVSTFCGFGEMFELLPLREKTLLSPLHVTEEGAAGVNISGGQWRRLAIARVLVNTQYDILILDEPTVGLDDESTRMFVGHLKRLSKMGKTIIIVSHDIRLKNISDEVFDLGSQVPISS